MWLGALIVTTALVAGRASADSGAHHDSQQTKKMGRPYLDEFGNICQDKMEMMEHVEYENQIMCKVKMKEQCREEHAEEEEGLDCHTVNVKKCSTVYKPSTTKVKVRVCPDGAVDLDEESKQKMQDNSVVIDVRPTPVPKFTRQAKCVNGKRALCVTKYETMCTNKEVEYEMMEDHPRCRVELIEKCEDNKKQQKKRDDNVLSQMMAQMVPKKKECSKIPAMRCRIEKMKVMKKKPETKCERMPRQFCRKEACESDPLAAAETDSTSLTSIMDESLCYFRIQMVNEIVPKRTCRYTPKRVCPSRARSRKSFDWLSEDPKEKTYMAESTQERDHMVRMSRKFFESPRKCEQVPEEVCQSFRVNPKPVMKEVKRKECRTPEPEASSYDRSLVERLQEWAKVSVPGGTPP